MTFYLNAFKDPEIVQYLENFELPKMYKIWVNPSLKRSVKEHNNDMALILMMCDISLCRIVWTTERWFYAEIPWLLAKLILYLLFDVFFNNSLQ